MMPSPIDPLFVRLAGGDAESGENNDALNGPLANDSRGIYTVTSLTREITRILENTYPLVWVKGEITNFTRQASSGHMYFSLKDNGAQISAVMFRGQNKKLRFVPANGIQMFVMGRISVYPPRGNYQLLVEYMDPQGAGVAHLALEQLKARLAEEGLFDGAHKQELPPYPAYMGVITSPDAAVWHDIVRIAKRRNHTVGIELYPASVQGANAVTEIVEAIEIANEYSHADVLVLARGGGAPEELTVFNDEAMVRAIFNSRIPLVSAIGHETDMTLSDLAADVRASTPSAAVEMIVPSSEDLFQNIRKIKNKLNQLIKIENKKHRLLFQRVRSELVHPLARVRMLRLKTDIVRQKLQYVMTQKMGVSRRELSEASPEMLFISLRNGLQAFSNDFSMVSYRMRRAIQERMSSLTYEVSSQKSNLLLLGPVETLGRGYTIVRRFDESKRILTRSKGILKGDRLEVLFADGSVEATVIDHKDGNSFAFEGDETESI